MAIVSRLIHKIEAKCSLNETVVLTLPWQTRPQLDSALLPSYKLATGLTGRILSHYMARLLLMLIKAYILRSRHSCINNFSLHFSAGKYRPVVRPTKRPRPGPPRPTSRPGPGPRPLPPSTSHWYLCFKLYSPLVDIPVAFCLSSPS